MLAALATTTSRWGAALGASHHALQLPVSCAQRCYSSALNGNRSPVENVVANHNPMLHQEDSASRSTEDAFELRVPGVVGQGVEANIPRPGTVDFPNPSAALLEKVPIAKVTVDGDLTAQSMPQAPGESQPRN